MKKRLGQFLGQGTHEESTKQIGDTQGPDTSRLFPEALPQVQHFLNSSQSQSPAPPCSESSSVFQAAPSWVELVVGLLSGSKLSSKLLLL
jgi:hypothetical protein